MYVFLVCVHVPSRLLIIPPFLFLSPCSVVLHNVIFHVHVHVYMYIHIDSSVPDLESKADFPGNQFLLCVKNDWIPLLQSLIIPLNYAIQTLQHTT